MGAFGIFCEWVYDSFKMFKINDLIDILLISYLIYKSIKIVRETRAEQLVKGIILLAVSNILANVLKLNTMAYILKNIFAIGIMALIILFQPELRRVLEKVGRTKVVDLNVFSNDNQEKSVVWQKAIEKLCNGIFELSKTKTGALIVIERKTKLGEQIDTGIYINAAISEELIGNIFFVNTPLHDGAMIVRDGRILAAACFLPKPQKEDHIASYLGSRHRAAIGISEISDSITIIVSEETGIVSIAQDGQLSRNFNKDSLKLFLEEALIPKKDHDSSENKRTFWRVKRK